MAIFNHWRSAFQKMPVNLTFDIITAESNQFMFIPNCKVVELEEF